MLGFFDSLEPGQRVLLVLSVSTLITTLLLLASILVISVG